MGFYLIRPALPYIVYGINKEYISNNLCVRRDDPHNNCHGRCHLKAQIEKNSEKDEAERSDGKKHVQNNKIEDHLKSCEILLNHSEAELKSSINLCQVFCVGFITPVFIPPETLKDYLIYQV